MSRSAASALLVATTLLVGAQPVLRASEAAPPAPRGETARAGTIEGVVRIRPVPQRRTASRYAGGRSPARAVQEIPPVVYLKGTLGEAPAGLAAPEMAQEDTAFLPSLLVVPEGTTVRFPNHDPFFHNVFSYSSAGRFDLGRYPRGESKDVTFEAAGLLKVYCEVHESMRAAILVVENRFWAHPDEEGRFRIEGVPAGEHTLVVWHADRGEREVRVRVPETGVARVEVEL